MEESAREPNNAAGAVERATAREREQRVEIRRGQPAPA